MKTVYLAAGAAGMYCGSCLHDNTLAAALTRAGHDVLLVPAYTPIRTDEDDVSLHRVFFGGVNVYLQEKIALFRHTPWWFDRMLDAPALLAGASIFSAVSPAKLGGLTVSMLRGEHGRQAKELEKLIRWLESDIRPDLVHLSNALLTGMAPQLKARLGAAIVCTLSGEDIFVEKLVAPHYDQTRALLKEQAAHVDAFVAMNDYYGRYMVEYLDAPPDKVLVIPHGLNLAGHAARPERAADAPVVIGYLARICHDKGLHQLVEAFEILLRDKSLPPVRLRAAGYLGRSDRPYLAELTAQIERAGWSDRFEYLGQPNRQEKIAFLQSLDLFCLPTVYRESKGIPALEALANAVPVVLPEHGAFPELVADTGGGRLFTPQDPESLAAALADMIGDLPAARRLGLAGRQAVLDHYSDEKMAARTAELYQALTDERKT